MRRLLNAQDPDSWRDEILSTRAEDDPMVMQQLIGTQLQTIAQRSAIQQMVQEELANAAAPSQLTPDQIGGRGQMSQQGTPQSPAPMQPPPDQMQMEGLLAQLGADQGMADNATPLPVPEENPLNNGSLIKLKSP